MRIRIVNIDDSPRYIPFAEIGCAEVKGDPLNTYLATGEFKNNRAYFEINVGTLTAIVDCTVSELESILAHYKGI